MIDRLIELDQELFLYLNGLGNVYWDAFWMAYTAKLHWIPLYAVLLYLLYRRLGTKMVLLTILTTVLMVSFTDQITNLFKHGFGHVYVILRKKTISLTANKSEQK